MKSLLKCKKGMTLIEVILALSLLAIFTIPLSIGFMNSLLISKKIERENYVNAVTSIIKERVQDALIDEYIELPCVAGGTTLNLRDFISNHLSVGGGGESDPIKVDYPNDYENNNYIFFYRLNYDHDTCYDTEYETVYHVIVSVYLVNRDFKGSLEEAIVQNKYNHVNTFKIGADIGKKPGEL